MKRIVIALIMLILLSCNSINVNIEDCVCGTVYVAGNEPFTFLAFSSRHYVYRIECSDLVKKELWKLQGQSINACDYNIELIEM